MIYGNRDFNDLFNSFFSQRMSSPIFYTTTDFKHEDDSSENFTHYEVNHTDDGAYLFFEAPGFNKSNLKVEMEGSRIIIEGKRSYKLNGKEISKPISKKFEIGKDYNYTQIEATIEDGLLTVFVPNFKKIEKKRISLL